MARSNKERTEGTRMALIAAGRRLFIAKGFADTATPDIVMEAGVTRGALYHHFDDKKALFQAVIEEEARHLAADIDAGSTAANDARNSLLEGARAYFDAMQVPGRTRLLLLDGPAILGTYAIMTIDAANAERTLRQGLTERFGPTALPLDALTSLLSAAFDRAALAIEAGANRTDYEAAIAVLIDGLAVK